MPTPVNRPEQTGRVIPSAVDRRARLMQPTLGRIVHYRGREGLQTLRAALVVATVDTLDPTGVESGDVPALQSPMHVHLHVFTPSDRGWFPEYDVPIDKAAGGPAPGCWSWPVINREA